MSKTTKKETKTNRQQDHDDFVRGILSLPQLVEKLLRYYLEDKIKPFINFATLKPMPDTHVDKRLRKTQSDSIHECELERTALPEHIRVLPKLPVFRFVFIWEHKSSRETLPIDFQVGGYDDSIRRKDFKQESPNLSIVIPILIYHGKDKWEKKRVFDYFEPYLPEELLEYIPRNKIIEIDIQAMTDDNIEKSVGLQELRAAFVALKHCHEKEYFKHNMSEVLKFVEEMPPKELFNEYLEMLFEYMQRRSGTNNEEFQEIVILSKNEKMTAEFKTIFQTAREEGEEVGKTETTKKAIVGLLKTTRMSDRAIAVALEVEESLVKTMRQEVKPISPKPIRARKNKIRKD